MLQVLFLSVLGLVALTQGFHIAAPTSFNLNSLSKPSPLGFNTKPKSDSSSLNTHAQKMKVDGEGEMNEITKQAEELEKTIKQLEEQNIQKEAMIHNLQERLDEKGAKSDTIISDRSKMADEMNSLKLQIQEQESTITSLKEGQTINGRDVRELLTECQTREPKAQSLLNATAMKLDMCEKKLHDTKQVQRCPSTFTEDKEAGICFGLVMDDVNFAAAKEACEKMAAYDGRLAVLNTQAKMDSVREKVKSAGSTHSYWLGGERKGSSFEWLDGSVASMEYGWYPGEPNSEKEKCLDLLQKEDYKMNDEDCSLAKAYVCEVIPNTES